MQPPQPDFRLDPLTSEFTIVDYNWVRPFSSFLPGIAGKWGVPAWAYWVSRGQAMSSLGVADRNGQILELYSFNKACTRVETEGFRTFLRIDGKPVAEPFRRRAAPGVVQMLRISPGEITIEETNEPAALRTEVVYHTIPNRRVPGLIRWVSITNLAGEDRHLELVDGAPRILPYGIDQHGIKVISRHIEAMEVVDRVGATQLFRLKQLAVDDAAVTSVEGANFMRTWADSGEVTPVVDPVPVFGDHFAFEVPVAFEHHGVAGIRKADQVRRGRTPAGFAAWEGEVGAGSTARIVTVLGRIDAERDLDLLADLDSPAAWDGLRSTNRAVIDSIADHGFTASASPEFDAFARQNFLDNVIRGGMPVWFGEPGGGAFAYAFSHQNADLERDYHEFTLAPTYLSEGLGHFRNSLQNRRNDSLFFPAIAEHNLHIFFGLIQLDGYNPLEVRAQTFVVADTGAAEAWVSANASGTDAAGALLEALAGPVTLGRLAMALQQASGTPAADNEPSLADATTFLTPAEVGGLHAGYWVDHWHYLIDLLEAHLNVFPDRVAEVLLGGGYTWFDDPDIVVPRDRRYQATPRGPRQLGSVVRDEAKMDAITGRAEPRWRVRTAGGAIAESTLLEKLLLIVATRLATLDPAGLGIEMEAGKPGWNDSMNGLPGLFGSGLSESIELRRTIRLLSSWIEQITGDAIPVYEELATMLGELAPLVAERAAGDIDSFAYWDGANAAKEAYRQATRYRQAGGEAGLDKDELLEMLTLAQQMLDQVFQGPGRKQVVGPSGVPHTYFVSRPTLDEDGRPTSFETEPVEAFLEGPMHWMREFPEDAAQIYAAVRRSPLYDSALGMYKSSGPMGAANPELGRAVGAYPPGWLENESIYTHMEYKYLLEVLRSGLVAEFWEDARTCLIPFLDPGKYGRSPLEGSSFIVSSAHPDPTEHGRGYQPRLSGMTTEFISIWLLAALGPAPFTLVDGALAFHPRPRLPGWLFTEEPAVRTITAGEGVREIEVAPGSFAIAGPVRTLISYSNPARKDTYGPGAVAPVQFEAHYRNGQRTLTDGPFIAGPDALALRSGELREVRVTLG